VNLIHKVNLIKSMVHYNIITTVELWTVKMCSSYRKFEPPKFRNFKEKKMPEIWLS